MSPAGRPASPGRKVPIPSFRSDVAAELTRLLAGRQEVKPGKMFGLPAFFTRGKLFACVSGEGVALRMPPERIPDLLKQPGFEPFRPGPGPAMAGWVQVNRRRAGEYAGDADLFELAIAHAAEAAGKAGGRSGPAQPRSSRR